MMLYRLLRLLPNFLNRSKWNINKRSADQSTYFQLWEGVCFVLYCIVECCLVGGVMWPLSLGRVPPSVSHGGENVWTLEMFFIASVTFSYKILIWLVLFWVLLTDGQLFCDIFKEINGLVSKARIVPKLLSAWTQNLTFSVFNNFLCPVSPVVLTASKCSSPSSESTQARSNLRCPLPTRQTLTIFDQLFGPRNCPHTPQFCSFRRIWSFLFSPSFSP